MDQIESTKTQFTPENPYRPNFNELIPSVSDLRRPEQTPATSNEKDTRDSSTSTIPDTSKAPRPGGVPSLKLSEGTDVFLPDMSWDVLDKGTIPGAVSPVKGDVSPRTTVPGAEPRPTVPDVSPKPSVPEVSPKPSVPEASPKPSVPEATPAAPRDGGTVRPPAPGDNSGVVTRKQEITSDKHGNVATVKLPDGSSRTYKFDESGKEILQITDRIKSPAGERVEEWTRQADPTTGKFGEKFSRTQPAGSNEVRDKVKQLPDGSYEYSDAKGERKTSQVSMQGDAKPETPWKADVKRDEKGRFSSIENERFKREYQYFEGTTKIKSYHVVDKQSGQSATWSRSAPESANWTAQTGDGRTATLQGEFAVTDDGVHVVQRLSCSWGEGKDNYAFLGNGTKVGIKATDGNGLTAADGSTSRYVKRADGSTVSYTSYDNKQISVYDASTKTRTNWTQGADGLWKSDSPYEPEARKDLSFNDKGELSYVDKDGSTRTRTLAGEEIVGKKDGSKLVYDRQGKLSKVIYGDVTRTFQKDEKGSVKAVQEVNAKGESKTIFPPALKPGEKFEDAKLSEDGDLTYLVKDTSGNTVKKVNERSNGMTLEHDKDNALIRASKPNGVSRSFEYAGNGEKKQLISVTDTRVTKDGAKSTVWARQAQADGSFSEDFHSKDDKGKERPSRKIGNVLPDGKYEYVTKDSKPGDKPRIQSLGGGDGGFSDSVDESRQNLLESMEKGLDEPRLKRMEEMMKAYEQRMTDRAVARKLAGVTAPDAIDDDVSKTVSRTYDNIAQMVNNDDPNSFYSKEQRAFLAENFMFHAQDPTTMDQGAADNRDWQGHGTCWIQSAHIWGMTQRTDHMADLLKQVSLTGSYTTKNSGAAGEQPKTVTFSKDYLKFPDGFQETNWSISKATDTWDRQPGFMRQCDGDRSPVGKIFDYTMPVIGNRSQDPRAMDGGTHNSFTTTGGRWYVGNAEIMQMVTGDKPCDIKMGDHGEGTLINNDFRKTLLEKGTVLNYSPGHAKSIALKNIEGTWCIVQDNQHGENDDRIIAKITDIQAWARGDRNAEQQVNEAVNQRKYKLETDSTIRGIVKPTSDDTSNNQRYNSASNGSYYPSQNQGVYPQPGYPQPSYPQPGYYPQPGHVRMRGRWR
ncbi:hypothetical protein KF728_04650 [Candidatus Obscuribacterales bacterium]|nr:hypothetical protein [Candidatus Obscuribacterales bacterium]